MPGLTGSPHHGLWNGLCPGRHLHTFLPFLPPRVRQDIIVIRAELVRVWDLHGCDQVCPENLEGAKVQRVASDCVRLVCSQARGGKGRCNSSGQKAHSVKVRRQDKCTKYNNASSLNPAQCFAHSRCSVNVLMCSDLLKDRVTVMDVSGPQREEERLGKAKKKSGKIRWQKGLCE